MLEQLPDVIGHALRGQRAGLDHLVQNKVGLRAGIAAIDLRSLAFADHAPLPAKYTADGEGLSPPLHWSPIPEGAASLVLVVEDADSPTPQPLVHAIVVGLAAEEGSLAEGALQSPQHAGAGLSTGKNSFLRSAWLPPDPPPGHGLHRYVFQLFALRDRPAFSEAPGREEVLEALQRSAVASGSVIGTYERGDTSVRNDQAVSGSVPIATVSAPI